MKIQSYVAFLTVILSILVAFLSYQFIKFNQLEQRVNQLEKQVKFHHNLWKQWFEYEIQKQYSKLKDSKNGAIIKQTYSKDIIPYIKLQWENFIRKALPEGGDAVCNDELYNYFMLDMDNYFWNRLANKEIVNIYFDNLHSENNVILNYLNNKFPSVEFNITTDISDKLNNTKLIYVTKTKGKDNLQDLKSRIIPLLQRLEKSNNYLPQSIPSLLNNKAIVTGLYLLESENCKGKEELVELMKENNIIPLIVTKLNNSEQIEICENQ